jgi:hypothetical protein
MSNELLLKEPEDCERLGRYIEGDPTAVLELNLKWFDPIEKRIKGLGWWNRWKARRLLTVLREAVRVKARQDTIWHTMDLIDIVTRKMAGTWEHRTW